MLFLTGGGGSRDHRSRSLLLPSCSQVAPSLSWRPRVLESSLREKSSATAVRIGETRGQRGEEANWRVRLKTFIVIGTGGVEAQNVTVIPLRLSFPGEVTFGVLVSVEGRLWESYPELR